MYKRFFYFIKNKIGRIKNLNSKKYIQKKYDLCKDKFVNLHFLKILNTNFHKAQDLVEKSFKSIVFDESLLKQSNFWIKSVTWSLIGTSFFAIIWLSFAKTDEVVFAIGKLEPKGDVKDIQIPIGGVIEEIFVESGDIVQENQKLIQLDKESSYSQFISLKSSITEKEVQLKKNLNILSLKKSQKNEEDKLTKEKYNLASNKLKINKKILDSLEKLVDEGAVSEFEYLNRQIAFKELVSSLQQIEIEGKRNKALIDQQIKNLESEQARIKSELSSLNSQLIQVKVNLKYLSIKSPVKGIIFDLKPTSPGYVAQSSEPIMKIVPFNDLEADIEIPSNKIGFVKKNMPVEISIDSFPASDFGVLEGNLKSIGSDALPPSLSEQRTEYIYPAVVTLDNQKLILKNGEELPLQVGMSLTANIKLRKVSYIQLLFRTLSNKANSIKKT